MALVSNLFRSNWLAAVLARVCYHLAAENHIPALISREDLEAAIYRSSTTQSVLLHSTDELQSCSCHLNHWSTSAIDR